MDTSFFIDLDSYDNYLFVFDHLPPRMKLCVDLAMTGRSVSSISETLKITDREVRRKLQDARKRFMRGENII